MADRHTIIQTQVITDWSVQKRGRLFICTQGTFRAMHSDAIITVCPYPKKRNGFPDLQGWELMPFYKYENWQYKEIKLPIYTLIEVKTIAYPKLTQDQIDHLNYCTQINGRAYVARESDSGYDLIEWRVG